MPPQPSFEPKSPLPAEEPVYRGLGRYGRQNLLVCGAQGDDTIVRAVSGEKIGTLITT